MEAKSQGDGCSHGYMVFYMAQLLYGHVDASTDDLSQALSLLKADPEYADYCSRAYGEIVELILEIGTEYYEQVDSLKQSVALVDMFLPYLEIKQPWLQIRAQHVKNQKRVRSFEKWDGTYEVVPYRSGDNFNKKLRCGGHGRMYGFVQRFDADLFFDDEEGRHYYARSDSVFTLGLQYISTLAGYAASYSLIAIEEGQGYGSLDEAARDLCVKTK